MDIAAAGATIIFVVLFVAEIILGGLVLAYLGYSFFHIISETAAGNDAVIWPGELFTDWLFKGFHLFWLIALSILPACLVGNLASLWLVPYLKGIALSAWFLFPVVVLSFLSGTSRFEVVRWQIVQSMLAHPGLMLGFYVSSAILFLVCGGIIWYSLEGPSALIVPVAALATTAALLIYARLLGRIAHVFTSADSGAKVKKKRQKSPAGVELIDEWPSEDDETQEAEEAAMEKTLPKQRPTDLPGRMAPAAPPAAWPKAGRPEPEDEPDDPLGPARGSYEVQAVHEPQAPARQPWPAHLGPEPESYQVIESAAEPAKAPASVPIPPRIAEYEKALTAPRRKPPPPSQPLLTGIYGFPFYWTSLTAFAVLWLGICGMGFIVRLMIQVFPA